MSEDDDRIYEALREERAYQDGRDEVYERVYEALKGMLDHPLAEVRMAALEAASDIDAELAKKLASVAVNDASSRVVCETAAAILAKTPYGS